MSVARTVQRTLYTILTIALVLVLAPWLYRWSFVVRDFYFSYIMRVFEAS